MINGGLHFITPVWGREYTRCFVDVCLPSLLAPGNIPSLKSEGQCVYNIYTTPDDLMVIQNAPAFELLRRCLPVFFHPIGQKVEQITNQYFVQSDCYRRGIRAAGEADAGIMFLDDGAVVLCVLTADNADRSWQADNAGNLLCARVAKVVHDHFALIRPKRERGHR